VGLYQTSAIVYIKQAHTTVLFHSKQLTTSEWNWNCTCARHALSRCDVHSI